MERNQRAEEILKAVKYKIKKLIKKNFVLFKIIMEL